jgi:hypothetical protein
LRDFEDLEVLTQVLLVKRSCNRYETHLVNLPCLVL